MQICRSDAYPNNAFLGASTAQISRKLASLQDFLRMRAGCVEVAVALSDSESHGLVDASRTQRAAAHDWSDKPDR